MSRTPRTPRAVAALLVAVLATALTACSTTLADVPLPGTGVSGETMSIEAEFDDALNLATGATVKVDGVDSGTVTTIAVDGFHAVVDIEVRTDAGLREGATARLRYTTPLGELFVDVRNAPDGELLAEGAVLTRDDTSTAPTVEDALSQASMLVNGGGLAQLQTVTEELNAALGGREDVARSLLERTRDFLVEANVTTDDIDVALTSLASVSRTLRDRERIINRAVREITPAARVLRENTPGLARLLREVRGFASEANATVRRTRDGLLQVLDQVTPVLQEFAKNRTAYPASLRQLVTFGNVLEKVTPGDYLNISLAAKLDGAQIDVIGDLLEQLGLPGLPGIELPEIPFPDLPLLDGLGLGKAGLTTMVTTADGATR
jgi:phospholipid/cholesterol/gamma-HCH transport system substrate-binding protein